MFCSVDNCTMVAYCRTYCRRHYARWYRNGSTEKMNMLGDSHQEKILKSIRETDDGCWIWQKAIDNGGYGVLGDGQKIVRAHRMSYEAFIGKIPSGLQIDHLCRNRACVNPYHMEVVTNKINTLRGVGFAAQNARKTQCPSGHPYSGRNLYTCPKGYRYCRECLRHKMSARYHRERNQRAV